MPAEVLRGPPRGITDHQILFRWYGATISLSFSLPNTIKLFAGFFKAHESYLKRTAQPTALGTTGPVTPTALPTLPGARNPDDGSTEDIDVIFLRENNKHRTERPGPTESESHVACTAPPSMAGWGQSRGRGRGRICNERLVGSKKIEQNCAAYNIRHHRPCVTSILLGQHCQERAIPTTVPPKT